MTGLQKNLFLKLKTVIKRNYELVDPDLDSIIWSIKKEIRWEHYEDSLTLFDKNKRIIATCRTKFQLLQETIRFAI